jgi:hypothetical protein
LWLHGSEEDGGKLGGADFFNGVVYALKGSKVHYDEDEAIHVPVKTLAFLVLAVSRRIIQTAAHRCALPALSVSFCTLKSTSFNAFATAV